MLIQTFSRDGRSRRAALTAGVLALLLSICLTGTASADPVVHVVQPGENLFRIGLKYGLSWQVIQQANHLAGTQIYVGQQLIIPLGDTSTGATSTPEPANPPEPASTPPPANPPAGTTYIVQRGDYLSSIARRFGVTVASIAAANNLADPSRIFAGQVLIIPGAADLPAPPAPAGGSQHILVDISDQRLYAYQDGVLVYNFLASTGQAGRETVPGEYSILNKIPNAYASLWNLWMPNWLGIYWVGRYQNGIHALPILSDGQRMWQGYLGTPASYGCVVLGISEAQLLYDWVEVGTPVTIRW